MDIKKRDFLVGGAMLGAGAAMSSDAAAQTGTVFPPPQQVVLPLVQVEGVHARVEQVEVALAQLEDVVSDSFLKHQHGAFASRIT